MGICSSSDATSVATAKLILHDGTLLQYPHPVKAAHLLHNQPASFICDSDDLDFDAVVSAIADDQELQPGHLYFSLPLARLSRPIHPKDMAALAVKASAALLRSGASLPAHAAPTSHRKAASLPAVPRVDAAGTDDAGGGMRRAARRRRRSTGTLTAITE